MPIALSLTRRIIRAIVVLCAVVIPGAAFAASNSFQLPEPNPLMLVAMGLAGVIIGRRLSMRKPPDS